MEQFNPESDELSRLLHYGQHMVTKRDDDQPTPDNRVNIEQSASGRLESRVLQFLHLI